MAFDIEDVLDREAQARERTAGLSRDADVDMAAEGVEGVAIGCCGHRACLLRWQSENVPQHSRRRRFQYQASSLPRFQRDLRVAPA
jgi:hypothetical protein